MRYYFAPMEGVTGYVFRNAHRRYFGGVDKYFMPFLSPSQEHSFTRKSFCDVLPEHNEGTSAVPQLLTKRSADFNWAAGELAGMGYREVNLNLGCPSGTVVPKGKGSGFLAFPVLLDQFLEEIFAAQRTAISVKTRLGVRHPDEFAQLLEIFNRYPIAELTIHPRIRTDFYKNPIRMEDFAAAERGSRNPVCFNGDLMSAADCAGIAARFPKVGAVMIGRGFVANPALAAQLGGGRGADRETLHAFHDDLYHSYCAAFGNTRNAMLRMKELWFYLIALFEDGERYAKKLKKTTDTRDYEAQVSAIFNELTLREDAIAVW